MKVKGVGDKGSVFSLRRRRMQIVLVSLFVLIGLYTASGSGLLTIFGSDDRAYSDVPPNHYAYEDIQRLHDEDILGNVECPSGKFCPADSLNRKTAAVWIIRTIMDEQPATVSNSRFSDVDAQNWKAKYIEEFADRGITSGCGDDDNGGKKFCPENNVLRKHMAIFIARAFDLPPASDAGFEDVRSGAYFDSINRLAGAGITTGCGDGTNFCPDQVITRAQTAIMLGRVLEWSDGLVEPEPEPDTTPPNIYVNYDHMSPALAARSNETVTNWQYIGPYPNECTQKGFTNSPKLGSRVSLDASDNGKWYCFQAQDAAGNWGFKSRQAPDDAIQDTRAPEITVSFQSAGPSLSAQADETASNWAHIGPLNSSSQCTSASFGRGTQPGSSAALNANDNGKWYCFRAQDAAGNWGFGSKRVPTNAVDATKPVLSTSFSNGQTAVFNANEPVKWSLRYTHNKPSNCSELSFGPAATDLKTEHTFSISSTSEGTLRYYCLKGVDQAGLVGYSKPLLVDRKKPEVALSDSNNLLKVTTSDDSGISNIRYSTPQASKPADCSKLSSFPHLVSDNEIKINGGNGGKWLCIRVVDDSPSKNKTYVSKRLVYTPTESDEGPEDVTDPPAIPIGYQPTQVVDTYHHSNDADYRQLLDDNFLLATRQSAPSEHLSFKLTTPGSFRHSLTGPDTIITGHAVHAVDYIDVSEKSGCYRELFGDGRKTSVNGLDIENQGALNQIASNTVVRNGQLPLFTFQYQMFACIKVTLWADKSGGSDSRATYKIFVTANPVDVPTTTSESRYEGAISRHVSDSYEYSIIALPATAIVTDLFSQPENRRRYLEHIASKLLLYVEQESTSANNDGVQLNLAVNLPGKFIIDDASDVQRFVMEKVTYFYTGDVDQCDEEVFKSNNLGVTIYRHQEDELGQQLRLGRRGQASQYLCVKIKIKGEIPNTGIGGALDFQQYRVFSYKIKLTHASTATDRSGSRFSGPPSANFVSRTETLETLTWVKGEDLILSARAQQGVADSIIDDTWESVALIEDASCNETAFENADEINHGSEITNPQANTQYCFRAQDKEGEINYINAFVTEASFADLTPSEQSGSVIETDEDSNLMLIIAISSGIGVTLLVVVVFVFIFAGKNRQPKFR